MSECTHCWHGTGICLTSLPAQYPQVCCHCDARRTIQEQQSSLEGHGPFAPLPNTILAGPNTVLAGSNQAGCVRPLRPGDLP